VNFDETIRARLLALMTEEGKSCTTLSTEMGLSHTTLLRKLQHGTRPLTTTDVDAVLGALGKPLHAVMAPVLGAGDREFLKWLGAERAAPIETASAVFSDVAGRAARLSSQGLLVCDVDRGTLNITTAGRKALRN